MDIKIKIGVLVFFCLFVLGFVLPKAVLGTQVSDDPRAAVFASLEPLGFLYPGMRYVEQPEAKDRCVRRGLRQVLIQTYTWMFISGPIVELCVYRDDPELIKSAGILER
ncbi:MAG: hypothetical protein UY76_C0018G0010 [Candidatus Uhrbacteria bacterium GW2011_GWA2_52_8d]|uniref:Uncharacterized protein n=1 Tax=Candidatus Uhrbacteria bacterium GW2011_GWA2_52_8d TaxID=1618979 RepID=A0A0G1ZWK7_9BACT|nr:MAG: hypothetical protein UY76_C0018G0010 [Candidatus Uhrbacteria bacterium GW2011_GWA2_52_8d]